MGDDRCVMDFPTAWAWVEAHPDGHDPRCSWATHRLLCDCHVLMDEYKRREEATHPQPIAVPDHEGG